MEVIFVALMIALGIRRLAKAGKKATSVYELAIAERDDEIERQGRLINELIRENRELRTSNGIGYPEDGRTLWADPLVERIGTVPTTPDRKKLN